MISFKHESQFLTALISEGKKKRGFVLLKEFQTHHLAIKVTNWNPINCKDNVL